MKRLLILIGVLMFILCISVSLSAGPIYLGIAGKAIELGAGSKAEIPEPVSMLILGSGLIGIAGLGRRKIIGK